MSHKVQEERLYMTYQLPIRKLVCLSFLQRKQHQNISQELPRPRQALQWNPAVRLGENNFSRGYYIMYENVPFSIRPLSLEKVACVFYSGSFNMLRF